MSSSLPRRRRRLLTGVGIAALALAPAIAGVGGTAHAATPTTVVDFSESVLRPGETVRLTVAITAGDYQCITFGSNALCSEMPSSFGGVQDVPFETLQVYLSLFGVPGGTITMAVYPAAKCTNPGSGAVCSGKPLAKDSITLNPVTAPGVESLTRASGTVKAVARPADDTGLPIKGYETRCVDKDGKTYKSETSTNVRTEVAVPNGLTVECSTRATNKFGWSDWSRTKRVTTSSNPPLAPEPPSIDSLTTKGDTIVATVVRPSKRHGATITAYQLQCVRKGVTEMSTAEKAKKQRVTVSLFDVEWACSARARNTVGWSEWSKSSPIVVSPIV